MLHSLPCNVMSPKVLMFRMPSDTHEPYALGGNLPELTGTHVCIGCLTGITAAESQDTDGVCDECAAKFAS